MVWWVLFKIPRFESVFCTGSLEFTGVKMPRIMIKGGVWRNTEVASYVHE